MKRADQALTNLSMSNGTMSAEKAPIPESLVEGIFTRLSAQLGAKVADLWGGVPPSAVKAEWAEALAGYNASELSRGLKACQTRAFGPTLGEFLRLCRPALDPEVAWAEAQAATQQRAQGAIGEWSHPAVYRAARDFEHELRTGTYRQFRKAWEWRLDREFSKGWQEDVQEPVQAIPHNPRTRSATAAEREHLTRLRKALVSSSKSPKAAQPARPADPPYRFFQGTDSCG
jgi:hypothetical protein